MFFSSPPYKELHTRIENCFDSQKVWRNARATAAKKWQNVAQTGEDMTRRPINLQTDLVSRQTFGCGMLHVLDVPCDMFGGFERSVAQAYAWTV